MRRVKRKNDSSFVVEEIGINLFTIHILQRSNGASLICLHEGSDRYNDRYYYYVLYGLLAWTNDSTNIDHTTSPHLFTNIYNYRYWLQKTLQKL